MKGSMQEMAALYEGFRFAAHPRYDLSPSGLFTAAESTDYWQQRNLRAIRSSGMLQTIISSGIYVYEYDIGNTLD
jgi:hypothetical protein